MTPTRSKRARSRSEEIEAKKIKAGPAVGDACPDFELETDDSNPEELHKISLKVSCEVQTKLGRKMRRNS